MITLSDYEIVQKCLEGDKDSFTELITRYKRYIFGIVRYYIKDNEEINDVSQEVFIRIYRSLDSYNPQFRFSTWSATIARNISIDFIRRKRMSYVPLEDYMEVPAEGDSPESKYIRSENKREIHRLIEELPEKYRELVLLYHEKGASYKEMAAILNEPMSMVKNRLHRARLLLRKSLAIEEAV